MEYLALGDGPRVALFLPGGPGSTVPEGFWLRSTQRRFRPYLDAGYTVWILTRRRHMPADHSVGDMADDCAALIGDEFADRVELVVGESYGGMIALLLGARHPDLVERVVVVACAAEASDWAKDVDARMAQAMARGDTAGAGAAVLSYLLPGDRWTWLGRWLGPILGRLATSMFTSPAEDLLTELRAEQAFDARAALGDIAVPVLLVCGDRDRCFGPEVVQETADAIPDCQLIWYRGKGHLGTAASGSVAKDVLSFVGAGMPAAHGKRH
ncbi:MAG TPA: alpha/beta hydrolase [Microlunatus sp.]|nr:alpha/beta hydrolase [Microlunatus sp.]